MMRACMIDHYYSIATADVSFFWVKSTLERRCNNNNNNNKKKIHITIVTWATTRGVGGENCRNLSPKEEADEHFVHPLTLLFHIFLFFFICVVVVVAVVVASAVDVGWPWSDYWSRRRWPTRVVGDYFPNLHDSDNTHSVH
jgi:hypothetical protein